MILAIDPGNTESGWCLMDGEYNVISKGKDENDMVLEFINTFDNMHGLSPGLSHIVIEMIASYGMAVGQTVFDTCVWVGRFMQEADHRSIPYSQMYRKDIKMNLCGQTRAKDSNIRQALVDRFSYDRHEAKGGKGTKNDPGFFFGFKSDVWAAYAVGVTYLDMR